MDEWDEYDICEKDKDSVVKYKMLLVFLIAVFIFEIVFFVYCYREASDMLDKPAYVSDNSSEVYDSMPDSPPHYVQTDPLWSGYPYGSGTVETHGCGLTCVASYISYITNDSSYQVDDLLKEVGNDCLTADVNDMGKFCDFLKSEYLVECTTQLWILDTAKDYLKNGYMLFASMEGTLMDGYRDYEGHIVLVYRWDEDGIWVMDPGDSTFNSPLTEDQFDSVFRGEYFYAIKK